MEINEIVAKSLSSQETLTKILRCLGGENLVTIQWISRVVMSPGESWKCKLNHNDLGRNTMRNCWLAVTNTASSVLFLVPLIENIAKLWTNHMYFSNSLACTLTSTVDGHVFMSHGVTQWDGAPLQEANFFWKPHIIGIVHPCSSVLFAKKWVPVKE